jgi:molybdate transport system substrate-binding protein
MTDTSRRLLLGSLLCTLAAPVLAQGASDSPAIAAASDLKFALDEIAADFERRGGGRVRMVYGSSGNFFTQIAQGAPFEMFLSADEHFVEMLAARGLTRDGGQLYALGRLVVFAGKASPVQVDAELAGLRAALGSGALRRLALANPEPAPYGRAAREALQSAGLWQAAEPRLVLGENVSQAAQFAASGSAQAGLFALSLALAPQIGQMGRHALLPESLHRPLRQRMVLLRRAGRVAEAFHAHLQQPSARAVMVRYGFTLPTA